MLQLSWEEIIEVLITLHETKPRPQRPPKSVAGAQTSTVMNTSTDADATTNNQVYDRWDRWSDAPVAPASDEWTGSPYSTTPRMEASSVRSAVEVGRACLNEINNKKLKVAILTPLGIECPSSAELLMSSFNKS